MLPAPILGGDGNRALSVTISADAYNVNLKTVVEGLFGTLTGPVVVVATINAGVKLKSSSTASASFRTGGFPSGSGIRIVNYGRIAGRGGDGAFTGDGAAGGPAVKLDDDVAWDNTTTGEVFGGGGGGGKGANWSKYTYQVGFRRVWGGPGGGGQGIDGGTGGVGGVEGSVDGVGDGSFTTAGGNGSESVPGGGGGSSASQAGNGGDGGAWGSSGANGGRNNYGNGGSNGGAGGKAVDKNGKTITWLAGNNSAQVKGAVS